MYAGVSSIADSILIELIIIHRIEVQIAILGLSSIWSPRSKQLRERGILGDGISSPSSSFERVLFLQFTQDILDGELGLEHPQPPLDEIGRHR